MSRKDAAYDIQLFQQSEGGEYFRQHIMQKQNQIVSRLFGTDPRRLELCDVVALVTEWQTYREALAEFNRTREELTGDK